MTRAHGVRMMMPRWILGAAVCATMFACKKSGTGDGPARTATVRGTHAELVAEATANYAFGPERQPVPVDTTTIKAPGGTLPAITIATATQRTRAPRVPGHMFIARLTSSAAYSQMGLAPGENYVWRDSSAGAEGPYRTLIVPRDTAFPMMWLKRDYSVASYAPGSPAEPRLVKSAFGYGACDLRCNPTHCAFQSVLRAYAAADTVVITP